MPAPAIGIDLGTTNSAASCIKNGEVIMIYNNQGNMFTPSVVHFDHKLVIIGEEALKKRKDMPRNNIINIKRLMGRKHDDIVIRQETRSFEIMRGRNNRATVRVGSEVYTPQEISAFILKYMKTITTKALSAEPVDAVITVPANFTNAQREATRDAGRIAGFHVLQIVNEPTAAAIAYGVLTKCEDRKWRVLVFDLGGGTFDVSIVEIEGKKTKVVATDGCTSLGGTNFDDRIYEEAETRLRGIGIDINEYDWILKEQCQIAKEALSRLESVRISHLGHGGRGFVLTRARFQTICADLFDSTLSLTDKVLSDAGIDEARSELDEIILVGGSTYIPRIRELLSERFPNNIIRDHDVEPEFAVAKGAAILADALSKNSRTNSEEVPLISLIDVTPLTLGLRVNRNRFRPLIPKNTQCPFSTYELCANSSDYDETITIEIMEGENAQASDNNTLARVNINVLPKPSGKTKINVVLSIDASGILSVSATDDDTASEVAVTIANMLQKKAVGIDLGTTFSCIACMKSDTAVEVVRNQYNNQITPSVVYLGSHFKETGEAAQARRAEDPLNTVFQVKRLIGRSANDEEIARRSYPFKIVADRKGDAAISVTPSDEYASGESREYSPTQISSYILKYLMVSANERGIDVRDAVITVPANFNNAQREATKTAGEMAGLNVLKLLSEPVAAALAYGFGLKSDTPRTVLVYDLGGGTFDVSIVSCHGLEDNVLSTEGLSNLGGEDFDHCLFNYAKAEFNERGITVRVEDEFALYKSCENAKKHDCVITRETFETLCGELFNKTIVCVADAITEAGIGKEAIDDVVMVGGSSRIPMIQQKVREFFGDRQLQFSVSPDHAVACGAAIYAESLSSHTGGDHSSLRGAVKLADVLPFSLGTALVYDRFSVILRKNTRYPASRTKVYQNGENDETQLIVQILEGQSSQHSENTLLGTCPIQVPKRKIGDNHINTTFSVDENGILSVHLRDADTNKEASTRVQTSKYTEEERMELVRNAREEEKLEKIQRAKYEARTVFADAMILVKRAVAETDSKKTKGELQKLIDSEDKWIRSTKLTNEDIISRAASVHEKLAKILSH